MTQADGTAPENASITLIMRRVVRASPERLFSAWTDPVHLERWWGPSHVRCACAEVDLRVGGAYRIGNCMPDGSVLWIVGTFEQIQPPWMLVYSWRLEPGPGTLERVTVRFEARGDQTEIILLHERIATDAVRADHQLGWTGCLDRLVVWLDAGEGR